ncbi:hypothetical protein Ocin01_13050 [Orchesella cincta]|uniref:Uncharacterized protein n=1 Tax=Orchesella cincta TaxID=48709 RepID=A0A1D2MKT2_ORCCI|nr:hypothetical protein Ocin01_13050 [Orchesella cincta]
MSYLPALKCYQCISLECPQKQLFCDSVKEYILNQLPELYYGYEGQRVSICPPPDEKDPGWEELRRDTKIDCEEVKDDEATCVLGRYRVTTEILDSGKNITSHGTAMGCAKRSLLQMTKAAVAKNECDMSKSVSRFKHSLRHHLEIEHCARPPDMCHKNDFCIPPHATEIKEFHEEEPKKPFPFTLILGVFLLIALAVIVLTFLAPFFNG